MYRGDEKLRAVCVGSAVRHRQSSRQAMAESKCLVVETLSVDGVAARPIPVFKVAALHHKPWDYAMEDGAFVVQPFPVGCNALLSGAERSEILNGFRGNLPVQIEDNPTNLLVVHSDIKICPVRNLHRRCTDRYKNGKEYSEECLCHAFIFNTSGLKNYF